MRPRSTRRRLLASVGAAAALHVAGCTESTPGEGSPTPTDSGGLESWDRYDPDWEPPETSPLEADFEVETVLEGLAVPWDLEVVGDGEFVVSERVGRIGRYAGGDLEEAIEPADVIGHATAVDPGEEGGWWAAGGEGGLLGIALHPGFPDPSTVYALYTYESGGGLRNRLVSLELDEDDPGETVLLDGLPGNDFHNGARLAFGPRDYLWVTTGDAGEEALSADPNSLVGKVLRLEPDGTAPDNNPEVGDPRVYSYGVRNLQTITFLPDGTPLAAGHGPQGRDEVQVLEPGGDHGWPEVRGSPSDGAFAPYTAHNDVTRPLVNTGSGETWAPSGGVFYTGSAVPALRNRLLLGGLVSQRLNAVTVYEGTAPEVGGTRYDAGWLHPDYEAVAHPLLEGELGRVRHVEQAPGGDLYALTSNRDGRAREGFPREGDDRLVRIVQN